MADDTMMTPELRAFRDQVLEEAALSAERVSLEDLQGVLARRKRDREDANLRYETAKKVRAEFAQRLRNMKSAPNLNPLVILQQISEAPEEQHTIYLTRAWPLAWKGWVNIYAVLKTNDNCLPPETTYRIVLTDEGREALAALSPTPSPALSGEE